jgi:hypothetical protein
VFAVAFMLIITISISLTKQLASVALFLFGLVVSLRGFYLSPQRTLPPSGPTESLNLPMIIG